MRKGKLRAGYACAIIAILTILLVACSKGEDGGGGGGSSGGGGGGTAAPAPDFNGTPTNTDTATAVNFTDASAGTPTSWSWDFENDGTPDSSLQNPSHIYPTPGTYSVSLTVTNAGGSNSLVRSSYVVVTAATTGTADIDVDTNRDGAISAADEANEDTWNATQGAVFYFNLDDDDNNNVVDSSDSVSTGNDNLDLASVLVRQFQNPPAGGSVEISLSTAAQSRVRVFKKSGTTWTQVYSGGASFTLAGTEIAAGDIELGIEARDRVSPSWDGRVTLTLQVKNSSNAVVSSDAVILRSAPPLYSTNLWIAEDYNLVNVGGGTYGNGALRTEMQSVCTAGGFTYQEAPGGSYSNDRWLQDSSEFAVVQLPSSTGPRRVIKHDTQLARWRPCDDFCEDYHLGADFDWFARFSSNTSSHNYGGNFEVVPPYTGKPYGRIMNGGGNGLLIGTSTSTSAHMVQAYRDFFDAAEIQTQFEITSEWLAVGHVDEFTMFIPAPNTTRGWVCLIASPDRAYQVLQATASAGQGSATVFAGRSLGSYQTTVSAILGNTALATLNNEVQTRIDQARSQIKAATGLTDADFIEFPVLFEDVGGNEMAAYNPGDVNLVCLPSTNNTIYLVIPDPEGPDIAGVDQWQLDITTQLNALDTAGQPYDIRFVDVFYSYHYLLGEAHCGSNFVRTPPADDWWNK